MDHSLDGFPVTVSVVAFLVLAGTTLALRLTGRSWRAWLFAALAVWVAWWAGVSVGRHGFSGPGIVSTVAMLVLLIEPVRMVIRAALVPVKRDGRH